MKFNLISGGAVLIYYAIFIPLTRNLNVYDLIAYPIAIFVGLIWNFSLNFLWTWRVRSTIIPVKREDQKQPDGS
jgi:putative flippase GtrA